LRGEAPQLGLQAEDAIVAALEGGRTAGQTPHELQAKATQVLEQYEAKLPEWREQQARQRSAGQIYNCGDEQQCSLRQVGEIITRELNHEFEVVSIRDTFGTAARAITIGGSVHHRVIDLFKKPAGSSCLSNSLESGGQTY
jgi:hypothetical protein